MEESANQQTFKGYVYLWMGQLFSLLGSLIVQFVLIVWITIETDSVLMLSLASFFTIFPNLIITPIAGVFSDRYDRKKIILVVDSMQASLTVILIRIYKIIILFRWNSNTLNYKNQVKAAND